MEQRRIRRFAHRGHHTAVRRFTILSLPYPTPPKNRYPNKHTGAMDGSGWQHGGNIAPRRSDWIFRVICCCSKHVPRRSQPPVRVANFLGARRPLYRQHDPHSARKNIPPPRRIKCFIGWSKIDCTSSSELLWRVSTNLGLCVFILFLFFYVSPQNIIYV